MGLRQKLTGAPVIKDWQGAEEALRKLAELNRAKSAIENEGQNQIDAIMARMNKDTKGLTEEMIQLSKNLQDFATFHKNEFSGQSRSKDLTYGAIGFRKSPGKLVTLPKWKWDTVLAKIIEMKRKRWLKEKKEVDKNVILNEYRGSTINDDELAVYGMAVDDKDEFWYEIREAEAGEATILDMKQKVA